MHEVVSFFNKWNEDKTEIVGTNRNIVFFSLDLHKSRGMQDSVSYENNRSKKE